MDTKEGTTELQAILDNVFKQLNSTPQQREQLRVWEVWQEAVGPQIADRTRPETLRNAVLVVSVSSSVWMQELSFLKQKILERLQQKLSSGIICDIRFKLGDVSPGRTAGTSEPLPELSAGEKELIDRHTSSIEDPELRESLRSLFTAGSRQKKQRDGF